VNTVNQALPRPHKVTMVARAYVRKTQNDANRHNWKLVIPFFAFPETVRRIVYMTNAIESLNAKLHRAVRSRGHFPSDEAATKLLYLVLNRAALDCKRPPREWTQAKTQFAVTFGERFVG
jgi:putative transposase